MTSAELSDRWLTFIAEFFRPPNRLNVGQGITELDTIIAAAEQALMAEPPGPVIVPARMGDATHYFGIAFDRDQAHNLRDLLRSYIGTTWTNFDGRSIAGRSDLDALDLAAIDLAGQGPELVFRFQVAASARVAVRSALQALVQALAARPPREARIALPTGRLLGDFADACAAGAEEAARQAYARLAADHRISAANRLFLYLQLLASFEQWSELEEAPGFSEVLRLSRPALASDALARLALSKLPSPPDVANFESVASRFGALIPSIGVIRSAAGARYYALWSLAAGESTTTLGERMASAGWAEDPIVSQLLADPRPFDDLAGLDHGTHTDEDQRELIRKAFTSGRFDAAVELLARLPPLATDLPVVVAAVQQTLTPAAVALLERHRRSLGDNIVREAMERGIEAATGVLVPAAVVSSLQERIEALLGQTLSPAERALHAEAIQQTGLGELLAPGGFQKVVAAIDAATALPTDQINVEEGLEVCIDLARDLKVSGSQPSGLRSLGLAIVEMWAYHDRTGDRRRLRRIIQIVDDLIDVGVSASTYDDLVEFLRAGWDPFLTDVDLSTGLDTIELLLPFRPDGSQSIDSFARPVLGRIGIHNARRLTSAALAVAVELAPDFGLSVILPADTTKEPEQSADAVHAGTVLALYSLMEPAAERAASILRRRYPGLEVVTIADHVATTNLRTIARKADLVVVMDRAAKHAATEAIRAARGQRPISFASGKGSTSLIEAAEAGLRELMPSA